MPSGTDGMDYCSPCEAKTEFLFVIWSRHIRMGGIPSPHIGG